MRRATIRVSSLALTLAMVSVSARAQSAFADHGGITAASRPPGRVVEMAYFHVPGPRVHLVADAQARMRSALSGYTGYLGSFSYQSIADSTLFLDYTLWDSQDNAEGAVPKAIADTNIAPVYFALMDQIPFFGHARVLGDSSTCAIPIPTADVVSFFRVVGLRPHQDSTFQAASSQFQRAMRGSGALYAEAARFTEYPEFFIDDVQFPSRAAALKALSPAAVGPDVLKGYFETANVTVFRGLFRPVGVQAPVPGCS